MSGEKANEKQADGWSGHLEGFRKDGLLIANKVSVMKVSVLQCTPEQKRALQDPVWLETMEQAKADLACILDQLNGELEAETDTLISEGRVRTTPARASAPAQPGG
jgi:hypothetical protein